MNEVISIVTPSLNQGQYLEQTINSVLSQEGNFFIDYIISDGGSTDNSIEIIKKYDDLLKKGVYPIKCEGIEYRWWSVKDHGQSEAINKGFKLAKGEILAWLNSDDFFEPKALRGIVNVFRENPEMHLIYGNGTIIDENRNTRTIFREGPTDYKTLLKRGDQILQPATFFTKRILKNVGFLDEQIHNAMDYDLWIRIFKIGKSLYLDKKIANARIWKNSKTFYEQKKGIEMMIQIAKKHGANTEKLELVYCLKEKFIVLINLLKRRPKTYKVIKNIFYNLLYLDTP
ncbi:MAG: hypothetical protein A3I11_04150 [Elusimicrobia bacterium RIFCSPLOWO2_02_FULL_39_32]|nr:MAG: hypothetical protein A3B80_02725 [Elusimicrobia bacterium RIFCSPHIGHO2_02_FULL_39_36]OGR92892.1 MAG: hypothetical protein A3I11_04150 [Elusimicrobia bacterium RIFCSPLOWO2_02_FULL_39_32]OGR99676.1 MAG: hypothetical protein A3G85_01515 [Elusimicrobia bacterium RIFCSPLOWO2_12_FULL_39_28]